MHFEILVEGQTELTALSILMSKIVGEYGRPHTWKIHKHRGIGKIPNNPEEQPNRYDQTLLHNLPSKLRAYGDEAHSEVVVVVLVDLDDRDDCVMFKNEMHLLLNSCNPPPTTLFRIAIEEGEAWLLGDRNAVKAAYPHAKDHILDSYQQDSICGTWEKLADAIYPGGSQKLKKLGRTYAGQAKCEWAKKISPHVNIDTNQSKSFQVFRDGIKNLAGTTT